MCSTLLELPVLTNHCRPNALTRTRQECTLWDAHTGTADRAGKNSKTGWRARARMLTVPRGGRPLEPVTLPVTVTGVPVAGLGGVAVADTEAVAGPTVRGKVGAGVGAAKAGLSGA